MKNTNKKEGRKLTELQRPVGQHQTHQQMHNVNPGRNIDENILSNILAIESQQQIDGKNTVNEWDSSQECKIDLTSKKSTKTQYSKNKGKGTI